MGRGGSEERLFLSLIPVMSERKRMEEGEMRHRCTRGFLRRLSRSGLLAIFESRRLADRQEFSSSSSSKEAARAHNHQAKLPEILLPLDSPYTMCAHKETAAICCCGSEEMVCQMIDSWCLMTPSSKAGRTPRFKKYHVFYSEGISTFFCYFLF